MSPSDAALADRAHWELAASPALRQDRVTAAISHESGGQLWVVSIFLCGVLVLESLVVFPEPFSFFSINGRGIDLGLL